MKLANILFFVKANMEEIVCDFYTTEAYWCHIDTFFLFTTHLSVKFTIQCG